jgi:hypothetical protein
MLALLDAAYRIELVFPTEGPAFYRHDTSPT